MYEGNIVNHKGFIKEADIQEKLRKQAADVPGSERTSNTDDKITDEAVLDHCECQIATYHMQWLRDGEVYRDGLVDLLRSKQVVELDTYSSLDECSFLSGFVGVEIRRVDNSNVLDMVTGVIPGIPLGKVHV